MMRLAALCCAALCCACTGNKLPELPPAVDACQNIALVRIVEAGARAMIAAGDKGELEKNAGNNIFLHEKCFLNRRRTGGPR